MGQIAATVIDVADIRAFDCLLPDDVRSSDLAAQLAEIMHYPSMGSDGYPMNYGLVIKGGSALNPDSTLKELDIQNGIEFRLVPEIVAAQDNTEDDTAPPQAAKPIEMDIAVSNPRALLHDNCLEMKPEVRIDAGIHREIEEFTKRDRSCECFGLLLGSVVGESGNRVIHVTAIAPAFHVEGTRTSVKVSLDSWESLLSIRDQQYADLRVLGWFHSHAGWGVFLSDPDVFIQSNFFPHPNMLAFVLDPYTGKDGFFCWNDGKLGLCPTYGLVGTPQDFEPQNSFKLGKASKLFKLDLRNVFILLLAACVIFLAFEKLQSGKEGNKMPDQAVAKVVPANENINSSMGDKEKSRERIYVLSKQENLWKVCHNVYNDGELEFALAKYNGIDDLTGMQVGQQIKLPSKEVLENMSKH